MSSQAATAIITVTIILGALAIVAVALRLYYPKLQGLTFGGDAYCMVIALVILSACI